MALIVVPSPGGVVTDLTRSFGNLKKPGSRPCGLPARSGFGPSNGTYVGNLTAPPVGVPAPAVVPPPVLGGAAGAHAWSSEAPRAPAASMPVRTTNVRRFSVSPTVK